MTHDENRISDLIDGGIHDKSAIDRAKYELHMRQKAAIEEAAIKTWEEDAKTNPTPVNPHAYVYGFKAGAKTILENPSEWGLCSLEVLEATSVSVGKAWADNDRLKSQLTEYREALDKITQVSGNPISSGIAKETLKQEVNND